MQNQELGLMPGSNALRIHCTLQTALPRIVEFVPTIHRAGYNVVFTNPLLTSFGKTHSYDVSDPSQWDAGRGVDSAYPRLVDALQNEKMGLIFDLVHHRGVAGVDLSTVPCAADLDERTFMDHRTLRRLRVEDPEVFGRWFGMQLDALNKLPIPAAARVDSEPYLYDPARFARYFHIVAPGRTLLGETTLEPNESMPPGWDGATGQDATRDTRGVLVNRDKHWRVLGLYYQITSGESWEEAKKAGRLHRLVCFVPEVSRLLQLCRGSHKQIDQTQLGCALLNRQESTISADTHVQREFELTRLAIHTKGWATAAFRFGGAPCFNEGCFNPESPAVRVPEFHDRNVRRARFYPRGLVLNGGNHDYLYGGDCGAWGLAALELAADFEDTVLEFSQAQDAHDPLVKKPDMWYVFWLLLMSPTIPLTDLRQQVVKMLREGGERSDWDWKEAGWVQDELYEQLVLRFLSRAVDSQGRYRRILDPLLTKCTELGRKYSIMLALLAETIPGITEEYQHFGHWFFNGTDPLNRTEANFEELQELVGAFKPLDAKPTVASIKLLEPTSDTTKFGAGLAIRRTKRQYEKAFAGGYASLENGIPDGVVAYARRGADNQEAQVWCGRTPDAIFAGPGNGWTNRLAFYKEDLGVPVGLYVRK